MSATEKVVNELNVSKLMLCYPKMLTSEMCFKIGQVINGAIDLLKEQKSDIEKLNGFINGFSKDAIVPVRCKDCKHRPKKPDWETYEDGGDIEFPDGKCPCQCSSDRYYSWYPDDDWFCADGERE